MGKEFVLYPVGILEQSRLILSNEQIRDSVRQRAKLLRHSIYVIREIDSHQQDWHLLVVEKQQKENVRVFSDRKWSCSCEEGPECVHVMAVAMAIQEGPLRDIAELNEKSIHKLDVATDCSMTWDSTGQTFLAIYEIHPKKTLLFFIERSLLWGGAIHVYRRWYSSIEYRKEMMSRIRKDGWSNVIDLLRKPPVTHYFLSKEKPLCFGDSEPIYDRAVHSLNFSEEVLRKIKAYRYTSLIELSVGGQLRESPEIQQACHDIGLIEPEYEIRHWGKERVLSVQDTTQVGRTRREENWNEHLFERVEELELSVRSANCLQNAGIEYIYQLVQKAEQDMLRTKNFGRKSLNEIKDLLTERNLSLGMKLHNFPEHKAR